MSLRFATLVLAQWSFMSQRRLIRKQSLPSGVGQEQGAEDTRVTCGSKDRQDRMVCVQVPPQSSNVLAVVSES